MCELEDVNRWTRGVLGSVLELLSEKGLGLLPWGKVNDEGVRGSVFGLRGVFDGDVGKQVGELVGEVIGCGCGGEGDVHEGWATLLDKEDGWIAGHFEHGRGNRYLASCAPDVKCDGG